MWISLPLADQQGGSFRVRCDVPPGGAVGTCVVVPSGQSGAVDGARAADVFTATFAEELVRCGIRVVRHDAPLRPEVSAPASQEELDTRAARLRAVLRDPALAGEPGSYVICGFSLGAQVALDLLTASHPAEPAGVVLVGCVVEAPRTIMCGARSIDLVYGGRDAIAYVGDGKAVSVPIFPEQYGARSAELLVVRPWQEVRLHLRSGAGHHLICGSPSADRAQAAWLAGLVRHTLAPGAPLP